jgi:hypothetical protein
MLNFTVRVFFIRLSPNRYSNCPVLHIQMLILLLGRNLSFELCIALVQGINRFIFLVKLLIQCCALLAFRYRELEIIYSTSFLISFVCVSCYPRTGAGTAWLWIAIKGALRPKVGVRPEKCEVRVMGRQKWNKIALETGKHRWPGKYR